MPSLRWVPSHAWWRYDMIVNTQFHRIYGRSFARVLCFILMKDIGLWLPWMLPGSTGRRFSLTICPKYLNLSSVRLYGIYVWYVKYSSLLAVRAGPAKKRIKFPELLWRHRFLRSRPSLIIIWFWKRKWRYQHLRRRVWTGERGNRARSSPIPTSFLRDASNDVCRFFRRVLIFADTP